MCSPHWPSQAGVNDIVDIRAPRLGPMRAGLAVTKKLNDLLFVYLLRTLVG
ncbi:hypothetical protein ALQ15_200100 [Pseudomonas syringae pv. actinidiae]|jgi:hypothetical protein|uniref:Uncharacterized protein n=1 Tax=Pseudomonas syringae pv. actinidiae TaxID=103796 RepID=A0A7Z6XZU3_PSESF|nr:hypothetical protein ALQ15_200100 [Pseudomonas syringae pv. actinidiae]